MPLSLFQWRSLKTRVTLFTLAIFLASTWTLTFYVSRMNRPRFFWTRIWG
jgi:hypothetical protein